MDRKSYWWDGVVTALSSISHGGDSEGTTMTFRREKMLGMDGRVRMIPVISGNAIRGQLRDCAALDLAERLGLREGALSMPAFHLLFTGGSLTKDATKGVDLDEIRRLTGALPMLAVFGGSTGRQILEGRLMCGKMIPIAAETAPVLPAEVVGDATTLPSVYDLMQTEDYTRRDDGKRGHLAQLATEPARTQGADDAPTQMRYSVETMALGTRFWWAVGLRGASAVELGAFAAALRVFSAAPRIGGKCGVGLGQIRVKLGNFMVLEPTRVDGLEAEAALKSYASHIETNREDVRTILGGVA